MSGVDHEWWAFAWLHYASLCSVIDGYKALVKTNRSRYSDPRIEQLLAHRFVSELRDFRDTVFHYTSLDDERALHSRASAAALVVWAEDLHASFVSLRDRLRPAV